MRPEDNWYLATHNRFFLRECETDGSTFLVCFPTRGVAEAYLRTVGDDKYRPVQFPGHEARTLVVEFALKGTAGLRVIRLVEDQRVGWEDVRFCPPPADGQNKAGDAPHHLLPREPAWEAEEVRVYTGPLDSGPALIKVAVRWGDMPDPAGVDVQWFATGKEFRRNFGLLWGVGRLFGVALELPEAPRDKRGKRRRKR